ncbi:MAG: tRNA (adenosine(37)-N6)-threonylcarbamoyltransferase complex ATPase subunit type 1 TsaE [Gammaproteobacteria bacterium]
MIVDGEQAMLALGAKMAEVLQPGMQLYLKGELGAGKTTFVRGLLRGLDYEGRVKSPTFTIVEPYTLKQGTLYHMDLYRIVDPEELNYLGLDDYFSRENICIVEWPEKAGESLPRPDILLTLDFCDEGRDVVCEAFSEKGQSVLEKIK